MSTAIAQLILHFPLDPVCTFANLVIGPSNRQAAAAVHALAAQEESPSTALLLTGESGTGKTHLLQAAVCHCRALWGEESAIYLDTVALREQLDQTQPERASGEEHLSQFVNRHENCQLVAVDDLEELENSPLLQEGLLYLFNRMRDSGGRLLVASQHAPPLLEGLRPDLRSRLLWGAVLRLEPPEDEMLSAILAKMVEDRQVRCTPELLRFLHLRLPRRIADYAAALDRLNTASLGLQRPLTVPLAKEVLAL
ncbi:MAG: ATP-binding protein [Magnetococcales bacterium]|nr:ATP-binding protein [Magnetococcales bacterium]